MNKQAEKKKCKDCGIEKKLNEFKRCQRMKDGFENKCLECYKEYKKILKKEREEFADAYFDFK